jgi:putative pyruvate formate lyase activating enzyme
MTIVNQDTILQNYTSCKLCPRNCSINRSANLAGYCGETAELKIAAATIHRGEEPPITGIGGSGTIFVAGCTLGCKFCQNWQISQNGMGRLINIDEFSRICLDLQDAGAENINIVTGSHVIPSIAAGAKLARQRGLFIPILWNSSSYENVSALELLKDTVSVYLPDLKTLDNNISKLYFNAEDYPETAQAAILKMMDFQHLQFGKVRTEKSLGKHIPQPDEMNHETVLLSGVIIRHLVLPGHLESSRKVLRWFADHALGKALLSLMMQYTPVYQNENEQRKSDAAKIPSRYVNEREYETVTGWLEEYGIDDGFYQELVPDNDWLPDFNKHNPFSSELSRTIWHWKA